MRSRSALYVDAGYLIAAAATRVTGSSIRRGISVDYTVLLADLIALVEQRSGLPLLRVYWYDAARDGKATSAQEEISLLPRVKLRLGRIGVDGEQKGVDLRIGLDMVGHSRTGAVDTMYLLSGDDDLTEAVDEAQAQGVQVIVLAVPSRTRPAHGVSVISRSPPTVLRSSTRSSSIRPSARWPPPGSRLRCRPRHLRPPLRRPPISRGLRPQHRLRDPSRGRPRAMQRWSTHRRTLDLQSRVRPRPQRR
ncbi:NYN domain protein [Rathayibacter tanaceti]|uniref:NYN domain protein n=1 Tax=Rathayibacter tanaceti TaxID=1671680 RepID=A0A162J3C7_9MICO|nr:NYN domain protein [Rathayibacter tanaceti]